MCARRAPAAACTSPSPATHAPSVSRSLANYTHAGRVWRLCQVAPAELRHPYFPIPAALHCTTFAAGPYQLSNTEAEHFQRGQLDVFEIEGAPDCGRLQQIEVWGMVQQGADALLLPDNWHPSIPSSTASALCPPALPLPSAHLHLLFPISHPPGRCATTAQGVATAGTWPG